MMKKFLASVALLGLVAANLVAGDVKVYEDSVLTLNKMQGGTVFYSVYDRSGNKIGEDKYTPSLRYDHIDLKLAVDREVNKSCKNKRIYAMTEYDFICGTEKRKFDLLQIITGQSLRVKAIQ